MIRFLEYLKVFIQMKRNYVESRKGLNFELSDAHFEGRIEAYNEILNEIEFQMKLHAGEE
jgi:hypothetical protein